MATLVCKGSKPNEVRVPLLAYKDAANILGLPLGTLYALVSRRQIPHVRLGKRLVRFDQGQLAAWVSSRCVASDGHPGELRADVPAIRSSSRRTTRKGSRK